MIDVGDHGQADVGNNQHRLGVLAALCLSDGLSLFGRGECAVVVALQEIKVRLPGGGVDDVLQGFVFDQRRNRRWQVWQGGAPWADPASGYPSAVLSGSRLGFGVCPSSGGPYDQGARAGRAEDRAASVTGHQSGA